MTTQPPEPHRLPARLRADAWLDRDGRIHTGDGPYQHRPWRRLRRALTSWWQRRR